MLFSGASLGNKKKRVLKFLLILVKFLVSQIRDVNHSLKLVHECTMLVRDALLVFVITE